MKVVGVGSKRALVLLSLLSLAGACAFDGNGVGPGGGDDDVPAPDAALPADDAPPPPPPPPPDPPGLVRAKRAPAGMSMDADLGEWSGSMFYYFPISASPHRAITGPGYADSFTIQFAAMHDDNYLYFAFVVVDDVAATSGGQLYDDDGVAIYLDAAGDGTGPFAQDDHEIVINNQGTWRDYATTGSAIELYGDLTPAGAAQYTLELRLTKDSLGGGALPQTLGFDVAITDNDGLGATTADGYGLWYVAPRVHCASCCASWGQAEAWCDTSMFGSLWLE